MPRTSPWGIFERLELWLRSSVRRARIGLFATLSQ